jgi:putative spermidine/putrescine transport system permease protein
MVQAPARIASGSKASPDMEALSFHAVMLALAAISIVLILAPTVIVLIVSFTSDQSLRFPPTGFSLQWYSALAQDTALKFAAWNSFKIALATTAVSIVLGVAAALTIARSRSWQAQALDQLFMSPLVLPALAFALAALMFFSMVGFPISTTALVIGHTVVCIPYVIRNTVAALHQVDPALLECSASLGGSKFYTFRRVTLPLIRPGILAGAFICFMSSFDNVPVSLFLRDAATDMLPIRMWQNLENSLDVTIAAVSGVLIAFTVVLMIVMERLTGLSRRLA